MWGMHRMFRPVTFGDARPHSAGGEEFWMAGEEQTRSSGWRCRHLHPGLVMIASGGERRVRCLGCGAIGPSRPALGLALLALRGSFDRSEGTT